MLLMRGIQWALNKCLAREKERGMCQRTLQEERKEGKKSKRIKVQRGWGNRLRSHSTTGLTGPGLSELFLRTRGSEARAGPGWQGGRRGRSGTIIGHLKASAFLPPGD